MSPEEKIVALGFELPPALPPRANYLPHRRAGELWFLAGHGPRLQDNTYRLGKITSQKQTHRVDHGLRLWPDSARRVRRRASRLNAPPPKAVSCRKPPAIATFFMKSVSWVWSAKLR